MQIVHAMQYCFRKSKNPGNHKGDKRVQAWSGKKKQNKMIIHKAQASWK